MLHNTSGHYQNLKVMVSIIGMFMSQRKKCLIAIICLLLLGITYVTALEEFSSSEGKVVKIESQDELFNVVSGLDLNTTNPVYLMIPRPAKPTEGKCVGCGNATTPRWTCDCCYHCRTYDGHIGGSTCPSVPDLCSATDGCCANNGDCLDHCY